MRSKTKGDRKTLLTSLLAAVQKACAEEAARHGLQLAEFKQRAELLPDPRGGEWSVKQLLEISVAFAVAPSSAKDAGKAPAAKGKAVKRCPAKSLSS